jgi:GntR family transcriptional repressor for pyruvate dehydrogenase complex
MTAKPLARQPLTRQVLQSLIQNIADRGLGADDRLPTERELAAELQVSRNTVREALGSLEAIGAVDRSPKRGAVLKPVDLSALAGISQSLLIRSAADFEELLAARQAFEIGLLPLVALHATPDDFLQMEAANLTIETEVAAGWIPLEGDLAFHKAVLHASHNRFLIQFGKLLDEFFRGFRSRTASDPSVFSRTLMEHRQIAQALRDGDASLAQRIMERHLNPVQKGEAAVTEKPAKPRTRKTRPASSGGESS